MTTGTPDATDTPGEPDTPDSPGEPDTDDATDTDTNDATDTPGAEDTTDAAHSAASSDTSDDSDSSNSADEPEHRAEADRSEQPDEANQPEQPEQPEQRDEATRAEAPPPRRRRAPFTLHGRVRVVTAIAVVVAVLIAGAGTLAFAALLDAREALVDRADPGLQASSDLLAAMVDQETGLRAYVLSSDDTFLEPYERGAGAADDARDRLDDLTTELPGVAAQLDEVDRAIAAWRGEYAEPTLEQVQAGDRAVRQEGSLREGRDRFDDVRAEITDLQDQLTAARADASDRLNATTFRLLAILVIAALVVAALAALLWRMVRRDVEAPLDQLGRDAEQVAAGDLDHPIEPVGPGELQSVARAVEQMRQRIVDELGAVRQARDALERQTGDLARSNSELEQFAYVASHDLQEPLRKVASFCQLLQSRYGGQLDDRADQYIGFAIDGAKRMQALINDLLAFSRVGGSPDDAVVVRASQLVEEALENLSAKIDESGAGITVVGPLPRVRIEASLGVALFQNLVANGLKFRRPDVPPSVHVSARRSGGFHEITVRDEGIGIPAEYAERIFVLFQRLHARDAYGGTGIGLALCRKIVEGHGGRIWIDTDASADGASGTTVRFTLPVVEGDA